LEEERIGKNVVEAALRVHSALGPGLLESAYQVCLAHELVECGLAVEQEAGLPVHYRGNTLDVGYRIDLLINKKVIVEIKAVEKLMPIHSAQLLSYLKLSQCKLGFLLNFNVLRMKDGIKRVVNGL
jgi:GxxExxY protein